MGNKSSKKKDPNDHSVDLRDFVIKETIGRGAFGKVKIVKKKSNQVLYALKYIEKKRCIRKNAVKNIFEERALLESLIHPFLINLRYAFQDDDHMFFVMDLAQGGDLRFHINILADFGEQTLQCYAAEACLALQYLHSQKIIHRDLKPDNFLLDQDGHLHLCDFNVCFKVVDGVLPYKRAGTLVYMAPELFTREPYEYSVDYWSLGVTLYECFFGQRPFRGKDRKRIVRAIQEKELEFPKERFNMQRAASKKPPTKSADQSTSPVALISAEFKDFLQQLMNRDPSMRLGGRTKSFYDSIVTHPWLRNINWDDANNLKLVPRYRPNPKRRNFDAMYQVEDVLMEDGLAYKKRKSKDPSKQSNRGDESSAAPKVEGDTRNPATIIPKFNRSAQGADKQKWVQEVLEFIDIHFKPYNFETRVGMLDLAGKILPDSGTGAFPDESEIVEDSKNDGNTVDQSHDDLSLNIVDDI